MSVFTESGKSKIVTTAAAQEGAGTTVDGNGTHYITLIVMCTRTVNDAFVANTANIGFVASLAFRNDS